MKKLTPTMIRFLREVAEGTGIGRSITNATMCALEARGLAETFDAPSKFDPTFIVYHWRITDAGREALGR